MDLKHLNMTKIDDKMRKLCDVDEIIRHSKQKNVGGAAVTFVV